MGCLWPGALLLLLLWSSCTDSKVYYGCGAVLNPTGRDLILSPGFPNNYLPGSHCLWQIFVAAGDYIVLETLDFDVYESSSVSDSSSQSAIKGTEQTTVPYDLENVLTDQTDYHNDGSNHILPPQKLDKHVTKSKPLPESQSLTWDQNYTSQGMNATQIELPSTVTKNYDGASHGKKPINLLASTTTNIAQQVNEDTTSSSINTESDPITTSSSVLDVCPLDVLYITDLITYSSRFCGSNSPMNKNLTFGSPVEMIEVVLELITTTNHGRGFALLFTYHNQSLVNAMGITQSRSKEGAVLLVIIATVISFALVLLLVLCLAYRQKICPKRKETDTQETTQVSGIQNTGMDVSEMQTVVPEDLQNWALESDVQVEENVSHQMNQEDPSSSTITATDSQSDEVFVISAGNVAGCFTFNTYPLQEGNLKRSITSPASVSDCLNSDYTSIDLNLDDRAIEVDDVDAARQRTWSTRTFNSLLPQLQMKWRNRSSSGSFTKLVDTCCTGTSSQNPPNPRRIGSAVQIGENATRLFSESSDSNASYPLTQSAKLQRKLPLCNLKRTRPYFGLLDTSTDSVRSGQTFPSVKENHTSCQTSAMEFKSSSKTLGNGVRAKELSVDFEKPNTVFVICEEADDQQPLVVDDQLISTLDGLSENHDNLSNTCPKSDDTFFKSINPGSCASSWINPSEVLTVQCMENNKTSGSAENLTKLCSTMNR